MKRKNVVLDETAPLLKSKFGEEDGTAILESAWDFFDSLCKENPSEDKAIRVHTVDNIYPCIALYRALLKFGTERSAAVRFLDWSYSKRSEKKAASIRSLLKIPGLYKLYPAIFRSVAIHQFGEKAGFRATFYKTGKQRTKFDMTECLYCKVCRQNGCPELIPCFCHTDDVCNGDIHPKLKWNRTKIMGDGGDVCDFDIFVVPKAK